MDRREFVKAISAALVIPSSVLGGIVKDAPNELELVIKVIAVRVLDNHFPVQFFDSEDVNEYHWQLYGLQRNVYSGAVEYIEFRVPIYKLRCQVDDRVLIEHIGGKKKYKVVSLWKEYLETGPDA